MSVTLSQFHPQLLLKLTLGQQFKQPLIIPDELKDYTPEHIEQAPDILQLNQAWVLMQQAGQQASVLDQQAKQQLGNIDSDPQQFIATVWIKFLEKVLDAYELNRDEQGVLCQVALYYSESSQRIPHHLVFRLLNVLDTPTLAQMLPERAYQLLNFEANSEIKKAAFYRQYLQQGDEQVFIQALQPLSKNISRSLLLSLVDTHPERFAKALTALWQKMRKGVSLQAEAFLHEVPLPLFDEAYEFLSQQPVQDLKFVQFHQLKSLYLYHQDNFFSQDALQLFQQCLIWDTQQRILILDIDIHQDEQLHDLGLMPATLSNVKRTELKACQDDPELKQKFLKQQAQGHYLLDLLSAAPLAFWQTLFTDWSELLTIRTQAQKNIVLEACAIRCGMEHDVELANWLYPQIKSGMKKQLYWTGQGLAFLRLLTPEHYFDYLGHQFTEQLLKNNYSGFYNVLNAMPKCFRQNFADQKHLTEQIMYTISMVDMQQLKSDTVRNNLEAIVEWLMIYGYPIDFNGYKDFISPVRRNVLSNLVEIRQQLHTLS